jgi:hypothetical protein
LFFEKVDKLTVAMKDMGYPFQKETRYLLKLDTQKSMPTPALLN